MNVGYGEPVMRQHALPVIAPLHRPPTPASASSTRPTSSSAAAASTSSASTRSSPDRGSRGRPCTGGFDPSRRSCSRCSSAASSSGRGAGCRPRSSAGRASPQDAPAGDLRGLRRVVSPTRLRGLRVHQRDARASRPRRPGAQACTAHLAEDPRVPRLARQGAGIDEPDAFARQWHILMKGSIVSAGEGDVDAALRGARARGAAARAPRRRRGGRRRGRLSRVPKD